MVLASQMRTGMVIVLENHPYRVVAADYHPGQGQMGGATHARLQSIDTGTFREHSFRGELRLQDLPVEKHPLEFLYLDGDQCCFMDPDNYEQIEVARALAGSRAAFLEPGMKLTVEFVNGRPVHMAIPDALEVKIADTAPASRQQQDTGFKPAKLDNGLEIMVPQFIKTGDLIRLDLETMKYMDRARPDAKTKHA
ncbi:MAG: translation elongation factor P [Bryobacteraceae bacterium]